MKSKLERRAEAASAVMKRYANRKFRLGTNDCVRLVGYHLRKLCGLKLPFDKAGAYSTVIEARRALRKAGHETLSSLMDSHLERIPWASTLVGDVVELKSEDTIGADIGTLAVVLGNGRVIAFCEGMDGPVVAEPTEVVAAWRALA